MWLAPAGLKGAPDLPPNSAFPVHQGRIIADFAGGCSTRTTSYDCDYNTGYFRLKNGGALYGGTRSTGTPWYRTFQDIYDAYLAPGAPKALGGGFKSQVLVKQVVLTPDAGPQGYKASVKTAGSSAFYLTAWSKFTDEITFPYAYEGTPEYLSPHVFYHHVLTYEENWGWATSRAPSYAEAVWQRLPVSREPMVATDFPSSPPIALAINSPGYVWDAAAQCQANW